MNFDFGNNAMMLAAAGYFIPKLRAIPKIIGDFIFYMFGWVLYATTDAEEVVYRNLTFWVDKNLSTKQMKRKARLVGKYDPISEKRILVPGLGFGTFYSRYKTCWVRIIHTENTEKLRSVFTMNISFIGKGSETLYKEVMQNLTCENESVDCLEVQKGYRSYYQPKRSKDTIYMSDETERQIFGSIEKWESNKEFYRKHGLPYKIGILLYGPPGTGKTSMAKAIASEMNRPLKILDSTEIKGNGMDQIRNGDIVLIEEIDTIVDFRRDQGGESREEEEQVVIEGEEPKDEQLGNPSADKNTKEVLSKLLNFIDGAISPDNVIFLATTNHIEKLDHALIRSGRFDIKVKMDNLNYEDIKKMCTKLGKDASKLGFEQNKLYAPSEVQKKVLFDEMN